MESDFYKQNLDGSRFEIFRLRILAMLNPDQAPIDLLPPSFPPMEAFEASQDFGNVATSAETSSSAAPHIAGHCAGF